MIKIKLEIGQDTELSEVLEFFEAIQKIPEYKQIITDLTIEVSYSPPDIEK